MAVNLIPQVGEVFIDGYGRLVRIICNDRKCNHPIVGLYLQYGMEHIVEYLPYGKAGKVYDPNLDLQFRVINYEESKTETD